MGDEEGAASSSDDDRSIDGAIDAAVALPTTPDAADSVAARPGAEAHQHGIDEAGDENDSGGDGCGDAQSPSEEPAKQRRSEDGTEVGAVQVDGQAPQLHRRFYLGLNRASVRARQREERRRRRERAASMSEDNGANEGRDPGANGGDTIGSDRRASHGRRGSWIESSRRSVVQRMSAVYAHVTAGDPLIAATLVEEDDSEVVVAQRLGFFERKWKLFAFVMCVLLILVTVLLSVILSEVGNAKEIVLPSYAPSTMPSTMPSYDPRPTLDTVQERGHVRCGMEDHGRGMTGIGFYLDLCRAVAAVLFGNRDSLERVPVTASTRFLRLDDRSADLLLFGDTHTVEREVRERTTGSGFAFSSPYYYDGVAYFGNETYVRCAEEQKRFGECSSLKICTSGEGSLSRDFVKSSFPSDFLVHGTSSIEDKARSLLNGTCNVLADDQSFLLGIARGVSFNKTQFLVGGSVMTKSPLAIVTRNNDGEFSDIVNWMLQALYYGEEQGLTKNASLCHEYTTTPSSALDLDFLNAVYCVGNYGDIMFGGESRDRGMNRINDGSTGMLFAVPFGELSSESLDLANVDINRTHLNDIREFGELRCGVVVPDGFTGDVAGSDGLVGMNADYCRTLAAALFNGNYEAVEILAIPENDMNSLVALDNRTIDILAGARVELKYDFESPKLGGFQFSTAYYYGNETASDGVTRYSFATREEDVVFASFANCIVCSIIIAQENNIRRRRSNEMPLVSLFGSEFNWALRDAISFSGSYDEIYEANFGDAEEGDRGRNQLNDLGSPQISSFPGLAPTR